MHFTIIKTRSKEAKFPISTLEDTKVFEYQNVNVSSMFLAASLVAENFILNFPLDSKILEISARRNKQSLGEHFAKTCDYMILDFDGVRSAEERTQIINEFAAYKCVFFSSRSANEITNFNIKGILAVDNFTRQDIKRAINFINHKLSRNGIQTLADVSSARTLQITAPANALKVHRCEEIGAILSKKDIKDQVLTKSIKRYKSEIRKPVFDLFGELGLVPTSPTNEDKVSFEHPVTGTSGYLWYHNSPFTLWHWNPTKNIDVLDTFRKRYKLQDYIENRSLRELLVPSANTLNSNNLHPYTFESKFIDIREIQSSLSAWRDNGGVFCLKSAMGTGKTNVIERALKMFKHVLIVTPRVSLAVEMANRLNIGLYTEANFQNFDQLVCQYDSLFKLDIRKFQCVIIDEFMTLESHLVNNPNANFSLNNMVKLHSLLSNNSVRVMLMDALLSENILDLFNTGVGNQRDIYWVHNTYLDPTPLIIHRTFESFLKELSGSNNRRITVSCVSKDKMLAMRDFLQGVGHNVATISSDNLPSERQQILEDFAAEVYSALVYTPSISVGISIESEVDRHFHYDPGRVVSPIQSIQMMKRTRNPGQIDCFVGDGKVPSCLSIEEIRRLLVQTNSPSAYCTFNKYGDVQLSPAGRMFSWAVLHDNIWRFDGAESFALLAQCNFRVMIDVQVDGAEEFKGISLTSYKTKSEEWTPQIRDYLVNTIGDHINKCEQWITADQVNAFVEYNEFKRSYHNTSWRDMAYSRAALKGDFAYRYAFAKFCEVQDILEREGQISEKQVAKLKLDSGLIKMFGLVKVRKFLGNKYEEREDFKNLYWDIWNDVDSKNAIESK